MTDYPPDPCLDQSPRGPNSFPWIILIVFHQQLNTTSQEAPFLVPLLGLNLDRLPDIAPQLGHPPGHRTDHPDGDNGCRLSHGYHALLPNPQDQKSEDGREEAPVWMTHMSGVLIRQGRPCGHPGWP